MSEIHFYEKPGCINNTRQKQLLRQSGHQVIEHSLLNEPPEGAELRRYFEGLPVPHWFNPTAPAITRGEIDPQTLDADAAIVAMQRDPLLIRRPLMRVGEVRRVGFDVEAVAAWVGLNEVETGAELDRCAKPDAGSCRVL